jgi:histidinol-phosphate aminotransferase
MMRGPEAPPYIRNLPIYVPGKPVEAVQRELGVTGEIIKLASNENPLGPSPLAIQAIQRALPDLNRYPDGGGFFLREKIAERYGVTLDEVILGSGSAEIIEMLARAYLADDDEAIYSEQSFVMYRIAVRSVNGKAVEVPALPGRGHDAEAIVAAVTPETKLIYLANPSNPTGTYLTRQELNFILDSVRDSVLIVVDQAYFEYIDRADYPDAFEDLKAGKNVIVLRTFSKIYGLAGLRIGYGFADKSVIETLNRVRSPFNTTSLGQIAGLAALDDGAWAKRCRIENNRELAFLEGELGKRRMRYTPSVTNFVLVEFDADIKELSLEFQKKGVIVRPVGGAGLANCARVSVGTHAENLRFLEVLDTLLRF